MSMDRDPTRTDEREAKRRRRLGDDAVCIRCGEDRLETLELNHPLGKAHDPLTGPLCKNCHAVETEGQRRACVPLGPQKNPMDREIARQMAEAVFLREQADAADRRADELTAIRDRLDSRFPNWWHEIKER